ncbi:MAG: YggT family protein [Propionibacteriaceae bacterium]|nr:YggT family protein [Propionibacteriaceae bacterium]
MCSAYLVVLTVRAVLSFAPLLSRDWRPRGALLVVAEAVYTATDPPLRAIRRLVKPVRMGDLSLDLAFIVLWLLVSMASRLVMALPI